MTLSNTETVRAMLGAFRAQDLTTATGLLADDVTFTSPQDDHIDKATYLAVCFPTAARFTSQEVLRVVDAGDDGVFLMYEYELTTGERYRNTEFLTVRDGLITEILVFFGGQA